MISSGGQAGTPDADGSGKKENGDGESDGKRKGNAYPYGGRYCGLCGVFHIRSKKRAVRI